MSQQGPQQEPEFDALAVANSAFKDEDDIVEALRLANGETKTEEEEKAAAQVLNANDDKKVKVDNNDQQLQPQLPPSKSDQDIVAEAEALEQELQQEDRELEADLAEARQLLLEKKDDKTASQLVVTLTVVPTIVQEQKIVVNVATTSANSSSTSSQTADLVASVSSGSSTFFAPISGNGSEGTQGQNSVINKSTISAFTAPTKS